jgi:hypothetical protein
MSTAASLAAPDALRRKSAMLGLARSPHLRALLRRWKCWRFWTKSRSARCSAWKT